MFSVLFTAFTINNVYICHKNWFLWSSCIFSSKLTGDLVPFHFLKLLCYNKTSWKCGCTKKTQLSQLSALSLSPKVNSTAVFGFKKSVDNKLTKLKPPPEFPEFQVFLFCKKKIYKCSFVEIRNKSTTSWSLRNTKKYKSQLIAINWSNVLITLSIGWKVWCAFIYSSAEPYLWFLSTSAEWIHTKTSPAHSACMENSSS